MHILGIVQQKHPKLGNIFSGEIPHIPGPDLFGHLIEYNPEGEVRILNPTHNLQNVLHQVLHIAQLDALKEKPIGDDVFPDCVLARPVQS